jgi:hypothetical protein
MTSPTDAKRLEELWCYSINYGPEGEDNYANVYAHDGILVGNLRTHHAAAIVERMNSFTSLNTERDRMREAVKPFAKMADQMPASKTGIAWGYDFTAITFEDFRKAASLIKEGDSRS